MSFPNRTLCDVLEEMRKCSETRNFSYLPGLIEEVQSMGNRMEAAMYDLNDIERYQETRTSLEKKINQLSKEIETLEEKKNEFEEEKEAA